MCGGAATERKCRPRDDASSVRTNGAYGSNRPKRRHGCEGAAGTQRIFVSAAASTGSRRAARSPDRARIHAVSADASSAATIDQAARWPGWRDREIRTRARRRQHPTARHEREGRRLDQELPQDGAACGSSALRTPISRVRSVTEIIMRRSPPRRPPSSRSTTAPASRKNIPVTLFHVEQLVLGHDREVVVFPRLSPRIERSVATIRPSTPVGVFGGRRDGGRIHPLKYGTCLTNAPCGMPRMRRRAADRLGGCA